MRKVLYISSIVLLAASCARETLVEDLIAIPEGERMVFTADLGDTVKSTFADDGRTLVWEPSDRVFVMSAKITGENFASEPSLQISIDPQNPAKATILSAKKRSFWVGGDNGNDDDVYSFFALYPASAATNATLIIEGSRSWVPVTVPAVQDGVHFGQSQVCADLMGANHTRAQILSGGTTVQFNNFQPMTALLNFNMSMTAGTATIKKIRISSHFDVESGSSAYLAGAAAISDNGSLVPASSVASLSGESTTSIEIDLPSEIEVGTTAGDRVLASILPSVAPGAYQLEFEAYDAEGNLRLQSDTESLVTSPAEGFLPGKKYTFTVAMKEAETTVLAVDCVRSFPPEGGTYTGRVVSYTYVAGAKTAVDWDMAAYEDESCTRLIEDYSTFDNWAHITSFTLSDTEVGVTMFEYAVNANTNIELISQPDDVTAEIRAFLQGETYRGDKVNDSPWNLAASDGSLTPEKFNSANCYVVNAPGYYLLPCVAGNGIKGGEVNTTAYRPLPSYEEGKDPLFVDYLGNPMIDPRIGHTSSGSGTPFAAYLLWEDAEGLISTSSDYAPVLPSDLPEQIAGYLTTISEYALPVVYDSSTDMWGIKFEITQGNIDQGNAVIAVVDDQARIMWSWHIWVTDYNPYLSIIPVQSYWSEGDYSFMKRNIGWVMTGESNEIKYKSNAMYVKVWQVRTDPETGVKEAIPESEGGRSIVVPLLQEGTHLFDAAIQHGYGPYYQAGRKDPLTPGMRGPDGYMHDVPTYGAVKALTGLNFVAENRAATLADGIQYPYTYFYQYTDGGYSLNSGGWFTDNITAAEGFLWNNVKLDGFSTGMISDIISRKDPTVKTIYDPNPSGFAMPPMDAGGTFFAFFTGGKYENYLSTLVGDPTLRDKYVSLLVSASEYGCLFYASLADKERDASGSSPVNLGFMPQVGRRYFMFGGNFNQSSAFVDIENNNDPTSYINEMANVPNCGGYYSNFVVKELAPVMLCAYPYMYYGFLTMPSSGLPVRSVVEEVATP